MVYSQRSVNAAAAVVVLVVDSSGQSRTQSNRVSQVGSEWGPCLCFPRHVCLGLGYLVAPALALLPSFLHTVLSLPRDCESGRNVWIGVRQTGAGDVSTRAR